MNLRRIVNIIKWAYRNTVNKRKPVEIMEYSQPYALSARAQWAGITHDLKAIVDIGPVRLERTWDTGKPVIFFCPTDRVLIKEILQPGDGGKLPEKVVLNGLKPPKSSYLSQRYYLKNVIFHSNGVISLTPTPQTEWVKDFS